MRKLCGLMVALCVLLPVFLVTGYEALAFEGVTVTLDGVPIEASGVAPTIYDDRVLMSAYDIAEVFGLDLEWDEVSGVAVLTNEKFIVSVTVDDGRVEGNGVWGRVHGIGGLLHGGLGAGLYVYPVYLQLVDGVPMLPVRKVLEGIGYVVGWDEGSRTVSIVSYLPVVRYYFRDIGISVEFPAWLDGTFGVDEWVSESGTEWLINDEWVYVGVKTAYVVDLYHIASREKTGGGGWMFSFIREEGEHESFEPPMINGHVLMHADGYTFYVLHPTGVEYDDTPGSIATEQYYELTGARFPGIINSIRLLPPFADGE